MFVSSVRTKRKRPAKKAKGKDTDDECASDDDSRDQTNIEKVINDGDCVVDWLGLLSLVCGFLSLSYLWFFR